MKRTLVMLLAICGLFAFVSSAFAADPMPAGTEQKMGATDQSWKGTLTSGPNNSWWITTATGEKYSLNVMDEKKKADLATHANQKIEVHGKKMGDQISVTNFMKATM